MHALIIAAACLAPPVIFIAAVWLCDYRARDRERPPEPVAADVTGELGLAA